jgi:hypothetical protein
LVLGQNAKVLVTGKLMNRYWGVEIILALCCTVACGDEDLGTVPTVTAPNQPSTGGSATTPSADDRDSPADEAMPGASGTGGAGDVPGMGPLDLGGMGSGGSGGSASTDPGCTGDADADGDGVSDCLDGCPEDPSKLEAGACGCGARDTDIDFDGALDCQEMCPADPGKTVPGVCGCGSADVDTDADGTLDCNDGCPFDAARVAPGVCGCGAADTLPLCLRHRYSFDGMGAVAADGMGDADGDIVGTTLSGNGNTSSCRRASSPRSA